jgi:hypothetical protein
MQNLNSLTLFVRELSRIRTDGHGNLISPKAGLNIAEEDDSSIIKYRKQSEATLCEWSVDNITISS